MIWIKVVRDIVLLLMICFSSTAIETLLVWVHLSGVEAYLHLFHRNQKSALIAISCSCLLWIWGRDIKVLPVYFLELLMCPLAFLPLVYMVFAGICLACVETQGARDVACDYVAPNYEPPTSSCGRIWTCPLWQPSIMAIVTAHVDSVLHTQLSCCVILRCNHDRCWSMCSYMWIYLNPPWYVCLVARMLLVMSACFAQAVSVPFGGRTKEVLACYCSTS